MRPPLEVVVGPADTLLPVGTLASCFGDTLVVQVCFVSDSTDWQGYLLPSLKLVT